MKSGKARATIAMVDQARTLKIAKSATETSVASETDLTMFVGASTSQLKEGCLRVVQNSFRDVRDLWKQERVNHVHVMP